MLVSRRIFKYDFTIAAGSATTTVNLNPDDLSHCQALEFRLMFTTIDTDAGDTLNVKFQEINGGLWGTRLHFPQFLGNQSPTEQYNMVLRTDFGPLRTYEESYEPGGSASATEIPVNTVVHGPLRNLYRTTAGRQVGHRVLFVAVDADNDASWIGNLTITAWSDIS